MLATSAPRDTRRARSRKKASRRHRFLRPLARVVTLLGEQLEPRMMLATDLLRADLATDSIVRFNGDTGAPLGAFVSSGSGGLVDPHNPTFGPDGNLYVFSTAPGAQKILKYDGNTGAFVSTFVNTGAGGFAGGFGMTFGPNGDLYVATGGPNVLRYNGSTGAFVGIAAAGNGIQRASGVDFGPDGNLYVLDSDALIDSNYDRILKFNPTTGAFMEVFVESGSLEDAISFSFGPDGHLYVPDHRSGLALSFNGTTGQLQQVFSAKGSSLDSFPFFLEFGPDGNLYAPGADRIARFDGENLSFYDTFVVAPGETIAFFPPTGPATDLAVSAVQIPAGVEQGTDLSISYTVTNNSGAPTVADEWDDVIYLSADAIFDSADPQLGRVQRTTSLAAGASYSETLSAPLPGLALGDYHVFVFADRRGVVKDPTRLNNVSTAAETFQVVPPLATSHDPLHSLAVGRTLSSYSIGNVTNGEVTITYSVYNLTDGYARGVLLATELLPGTTLVSASRLPDQQGADLVWSLGTLEPYARTSVAITVAVSAHGDIDTGPSAFAVLDTFTVRDSAPPAHLRPGTLDASLLAATPEANSQDPLIQQKAAELDYTPARIFSYLAEDIGFESYFGSLRGARGTMWSGSANALDEASLGVALMRASGIPARYVSGILTVPQAQSLVLSMFEPSSQTIGFIPPGTAVADPANDPKLLAEARQHYWFQFDAGLGFADADAAFASSQLGDTLTAATDTFANAPANARHQVRIQLNAESYNSASGLFPFAGNGLSQATVLDHTLATVELVGMPISIGFFVSDSNLSSVFSAATHTYSPYLRLVGDQAFEDDEIVSGTPFQETLTNFPFGSQVITGLFLTLTTLDPQADGLTRVAAVTKTLADRIGVVARHAGGSISVGAETPIVDPHAITTILAAPSRESQEQLHRRVQRLTGVSQELQALTSNVATTSVVLPAGDAQRVDVLSAQVVVDQTASMGQAFLFRSDANGKMISEMLRTAAYPDSPRLVVVTGTLAPNVEAQATDVTFQMDLLKNDARIVAAAGQNEAVVVNYAAIQGLADSQLEGVVLQQFLGGAAQTSSAFSRFFDAMSASAGVLALDPAWQSRLGELNLSPESHVRISKALGEGLFVLVPESASHPTDPAVREWVEFDTQTGDMIAVSDDGAHSAMIGQYLAVVVSRFLQLRLIAPAAFYTYGRIAGLVAGVTIKALLVFNRNPVVWRTAIAKYLGDAEAIIEQFNRSYLLSYDLVRFRLGLGDAIEHLLKPTDPPLPPATLNLPDSINTSLATGELTVLANRSAGVVSGTLSSKTVSIDGNIQATWQNAGNGAFEVADLEAASAGVSAGGTAIGSGAVALVAVPGVDLHPLRLSGGGTVFVAGRGQLSVYGQAESSLSVSGQWNDYEATISGSSQLTLTTAALTLNGTLLPPGTYTITTNSARLRGRGPTAAPAFAGTAAIVAADAVVQIGPSNGSLSLDGSSLNPSSGASFTQFAGTVTVASGLGDTDTITLNGLAGDVLRVATPAAISIDQNTTASFAFALQTSLADRYGLAVEAPAGWQLELDELGVVKVTARPGLQGGSHPIRLLATSTTNPQLVVHGELTVTVLPTVPDVALTVTPEALLYLAANGGQLPSVFRASVRNFGPADEIYDLSYTNVPVGLEVIATASSVDTPAGTTGIVGFHLNPTAPLPPPGFDASFFVSATGRSSALSDTQLVTFVIPEVHGVALSFDPREVSTTPGLPVQAVLRIESRGNVPETVEFTVATSAGLIVAGLEQVTLNPGGSTTLALTLTPAADIALNSTLNAKITAMFGGREPVDLAIAMHVAAPGVLSVMRAATASREIGDEDLADRLTDLSIALTNLTQQPLNEVFKSQAVASLDSVLTLLANDPILSQFVGELTVARNELVTAVTEGAILTALNNVGAALDEFAATAVNLARHGAQFFMVTAPQVAQPGSPTTFAALLRNVGTATTTYDVTLGILPAGVSGQITSPMQVTLAPGAFANVTATITPPTSEVFPFEFQVIATANGFPTIVQSAFGTLTARREFVSVVSVIADPPFADPGGLVSVSTRLLNAVNRQQSALVQFQVFNAVNVVVFTSASFPAELTVQTSIETVSLGTVSTSGFPLGQYRVEVTVSDALNVPIPGATGQTALLVGSPVTASLDVGPQALPPGTSTVTNTLEIDVQGVPVGPLSVLSQTDLPGAAGVVQHGHYVYASGTAGIQVFDIADPAHPELVRTFGTSATALEIRGDKLYALNWSGFTLTIYSLTDPEAPQTLGSVSGIPYSLAWNMVVTDTHVFVSLWSTTHLIGNPQDIKYQTGDVIAIDVSNPAAPMFVSALLNTYGTNNDGIGQFLNADNNGGDGNLWEIVQVNANTLLVAGSTAQGDFTQIGSGVVHVVDISDPAHMAIVRTLVIPGTVQAVGLSIEDDLAFVTASQGGWNDPAPASNADLTGNLVLATLDISNPRNPVLIHSEVQNRSSVGPYSLHTTPLGNGLFAFSSQGNSQEQSALFVVDASNPTNLLTSQTTIPAINAFGDLEGAGNFLYSTSPSGLIIYEIDPPDSVPVTARVQVPTNTGVSVVPGSFNIAPTSILPGVSFDTLVWDLNVSPGTNRTLTWQTLVTGLQPGETRPVTLGTTVDFTVLGTPGEVMLPPEQVFAEQILALDPATLTVAPGDSAEYTVRIDNPSSLPVTYNLAVLGVPAEWVEIESEIFVGPDSFALVPLTLTSDDFAALASYGFTVTATVGGVAGSVQGTLVLSGQAVLPEEVPDAHGVVVSIAPQAAIAGQGTPGKYIVRITNPGSVTEAYVLFASGLPAGFSAQFGQVFVELPPGASNYLDVPLSITPPLGTAAGDYPFAVTAAGFNDAAIVDVANAMLQVMGLGVALDVLPASVQPNSVFQMLVTNNGAAVDTFDLALGGPAAIAASLDAASVTLAPGVSRLVTISLGQIDFAVPGGLTLSAVATSRTNGAVRASDATSVTIDEAFGLSAGFTEHEAVLNAPGTVSFLLEVENVGNLEDSYAAEIVSSTGAVLASLTGLNGLPTASIPQFFLPGLASGAILLNVNLAELGAGSVTVQIRSLTNDTLVAEDTVTVRTVAAPTIDFGDAPNSYGTLGATGAQHTAVGPRLGLLRDSEADGQSSSAALGDDNFGEVDDEDGVTLPGLLVAGSCDCSGTGLGNQIVVNASGVGYLDAWIDFNRNGVFDSSEKIANSIPVAAGANVLNVSVPEGASAGSSYARFRISSTGGLGPAGPASDGEVEDYAIQIFNPTFGSSGIIVDPNNAAASVLYVKGTHYSDAIVVRQTSPGYVTVYVAPFGTTKTYSLSSFQKIVICGLGGADSIAVESPITKPTVLYGDDGPDAISGGSGPDIIFGGASVDALAGNAGDDTLSGGDGSNDSLVGGAGFDRLWESGSGQFTLTSTHFKVGSDSNTISQFEAATLFGGNASDSFNISGWAFPVAIEGGGGTNTIIDSGNGNFTLTTSSLTRVIGGATRVATFTNIHNANLTGGTANNSFNLTAWPLAATLSGAAGTDSFTVTGDVSYTLSDAMLLRPNLGLIRLSGFENATLSAGTSDNTFTVSGWTKAATLSGAGGTDKVISAANVNQTLSTTSLTRTGLGTVTLASIEQAELTGGTGNNTISAATFAGEVKLDGGAGNDTLTGGAGIALLLGGAGNDTLRAGTGRAVMIGGAGLDRLTGGTSDDLLISGQTAHDANAAALALLLAEWASTASYADRVAHLTGTPSGLNGSVRLDGANVLHDTAVDILLGGLGNDLFFAKLINPAQDTLSDKTGGETAL